MNKSKVSKVKYIEQIVRPMERGQITLPIEIRKSMNITVDTWLLVRQTAEGILIKPVNINAFSNQNIIPAERPFKEVMDELYGKSFTWTKEDEKRRLEARKLDEKRLKEMFKRYGW